ncbi:hypothetical protein F5144DRAFT_596152 [Chaetomium tenue]|uniref:Uncharacterized protein n=1 Tax=Chaetomium tenue TaxID=1854479 RepID=A0ACB7NYM4_9PEZI|nr:hypothetical protein F5144DRAFT_596152 [Chaetomium globosum]
MADSAEARYYEQLTQHRELDTQMDHQPTQSEHHGMQEHQEHQEHHEHHEHHELHQLQGLQESPAPQQQNPLPPVSADELQLAAQLSQGLAPMMAAAVQDQAQDQQSIQPQDNQEGQVQQHQAEPNLQEQLEASLQNHEREMQSHGHELQGHNHELQNHSHELQNHNHELQGHELQDVLSHPGQPQQHHYTQNPPPPPQLPHHMSMDHLSQVHSQYQMPDATPPRKRSKVSRACDECRRKKIKCDSQSEANEAPCSNCRRSNAQCLFSRVPQKRGPSKGYIKELADRINTIEGRLSTNVEGPERRPSSESFVSPGLVDDSRKRPFSSISVSGEGFQTPPQNRLSAAFNSDHRSILPYVQPEYRPQVPGNSTDLALKPTAPLTYSASTNDMNLQGQPDMMDTMAHDGLPQASSNQADQLPEIDDVAFDRYLEYIHPIFPVLASSKALVQSLLWRAPLSLQNAFCNGFFSMMKHFSPDSSGQIDADPATTWRLLNEWEAEWKPRSSVTNLVQLQTLIMTMISVDCFSIAASKGLMGPTKLDILGRAVAVAYSMTAHSRTVDPNPNPELDPNSDDNVALRAWWVLVMLDRWHALGMAKPTLILSDFVVPRAGLEHIVGDGVYSLIRTSYVFTLIMPVIVNPPIDPAESQTLALMATGPTQMLSWVLTAKENHAVLDLAYWHLRAVSELLSPDRAQRPLNILQATRCLAGLLAAKHDLLSPVTHHFAAVAALGLIELHRFPVTRDEAVRITKEVLEYSIAPSAWRAAVRDKLSWYLARLPNAAGQSATATNGQNLQQLADLATAVDATNNSTAAGTGVPAAPIAAMSGDAQPAEAAPGASGAGAGSVENGAPSADGDGAAAAAAAAVAAAAVAAVKSEAESVEDRDAPLPALVDVRAVLRKGYLTWYDEVNGGEVV